ncbi:MAG: guanylate kinase [Candidatus Dependentiae bacterium]|nr:guanylate kinase [Candidatus Dependentiae bacterium]
MVRYFFLKGYAVQQAGKLFVIMGPSGVGKTTLVNALVAQGGCERLWRVPTYTTRTPRPGEIGGVDYFFVSADEFQDMMAAGALIEWSEAYQAFYGLGRGPVEEALSAGKTVLAVVDRLGAIQVKKYMSTAPIILILPPSLDELRRRLRARSSGSVQEIDFRLARAAREGALEGAAPIADHVVINDQFDRALAELKELICPAPDPVG